jgi:putative transposase
MEASDVKRMKDMESEFSQLKRMYADLALEKRALKDVIIEKSFNARREAITGRCPERRASTQRTSQLLSLEHRSKRLSLSSRPVPVQISVGTNKFKK